MRLFFYDRIPEKDPGLYRKYPCARFIQVAFVREIHIIVLLLTAGFVIMHAALSGNSAEDGISTVIHIF